MNVYLLLTVYIRSNCHALTPFGRERDIAARREYKRHESSAWAFLPFDASALPVRERDTPERCDIANGPVARHVQVKSGH